MSPEKMIGLSFAAAAAKLYEVFGQAENAPAAERSVHLNLCSGKPYTSSMTAISAASPRRPQMGVGVGVMRV